MRSIASRMETMILNLCDSAVTFLLVDPHLGMVIHARDIDVSDIELSCYVSQMFFTVL